MKKRLSPKTYTYPPLGLQVSKVETDKANVQVQSKETYPQCYECYPQTLPPGPDLPYLIFVFSNEDVKQTRGLSSPSLEGLRKRPYTKREANRS